MSGRMDDDYEEEAHYYLKVEREREVSDGEGERLVKVW